MKRSLVSQAIFIPLIYFSFIIIAGLFANNYSHLGQHASELGINSHSTPGNLFKIGILATSCSLFLLSIGLILNFRSKFSSTFSLIFIYGITFIFGVIFPIGSPWHGLYGFGLIVIIIPFLFLYELNNMIAKKTVHVISIIAGF